MAFALASRPVSGVGTGGQYTGFSGGNEMRSITDPVSGLSLNLEIERQNKQTRLSLSILFGVGVLRPDCAVRILG